MPNSTASNSPPIAVKFANIVFVLGVTFSIVVVVFSIFRITSLSNAPESLQFYRMTLFAGVIFVILFGFGLRLTESSKVNLSLLTFFIALPMVGFEIYLTSFSHPSREIKESPSISTDGRSKFQVIDDLRSKGFDAYPNISSSQFNSTNGLPTRQSQKNIYPLGAISNKITVYCNESGQWAIYESDEHGFNNPRGLYVENNVDIMLTGDSFAEGACVNPDETIAAVLRESGLNIISLGKGGNGSLLEFYSLAQSFLY